MDDIFIDDDIPSDIDENIYGSLYSIRRKQGSLNVFEMVIGALVFLTVVSWVRFLFADLIGDDDNDNGARTTKSTNRFWYAIILTLISIFAVIVYDGYWRKRV